jgi:phosphotransferase system  glucose/maltose/N-acetylglucosamine-specific IIC component
MTLNKPQKVTAAGCALVLVFIAFAVVIALAVEGHAISSGGNSTISEMFWLVWAEQPWVIWLATITVSFIVGFLFGHFLAQSRDVYEDIRQKGLGGATNAPVDAADRTRIR